MLVYYSDGKYIGGYFDVACILHNANTDTYHCAFFEEYPFPGEIKSPEETKVIRLKSKMHHAKGSADLEGAIAQLEEMLNKIIIPEENVWEDEPIEWDGEIGVVIVKDNWRMQNDE